MNRTIPSLLLTFFLAVPCSAAPPAPGNFYWFVPDGLRGAGGEFDIFKMAEEGLLPNLKKMMDAGSYGYSIPVYPSHTPANFAALMTGAYPEVNGVPDGPMRVEGYPLAKPSAAGFSSTAKKVAPVWKLLEEAGRKTVLLSVPGSTPPDVDHGTVVRGRWANWGADLFAVNFESASEDPGRFLKGNNVRLFQLGAELTRYPGLGPAAGWKLPVSTYSAPLEMELLAHGATVYACLADTVDDGKEAYDAVFLAQDKAAPFAVLKRPGEWTAWVPVELRWSGVQINSSIRAALVKMGPGRFLKLRVYFDTLNPTVVQPGDAYEGLHGYAGPMTDFPDNWPAQLDNYAEEKQVFLSEALMSLDWHKKAARYFLTVEKPAAFIHDIYTPNQMLESRWWLPFLDKDSDRYGQVTEEERLRLREEVREMYKGIDAILGEALLAADKDALLVLSSDHGVIPLNKFVLLNNLFSAKGLLKFTLKPVTGEPVIGWEGTKAVFLKMHGVYLGTGGLAGNWTRGVGPGYERLREEVIGALEELRDGAAAPFLEVLKREEAAKKYHLPPDRIADIVLVMRPGYSLSEDMSEDLRVFRAAVPGGYKQALDAGPIEGLRTPFVLMGPGVKKGFRLSRPVSNIDQAPTILKILGLPPPAYMQGKPVEELFEN